LSIDSDCDSDDDAKSRWKGILEQGEKLDLAAGRATHKTAITIGPVTILLGYMYVGQQRP
jgi:hypothetical protein